MKVILLIIAIFFSRTLLSSDSHEHEKGELHQSHDERIEDKHEHDDHGDHNEHDEHDEHADHDDHHGEHDEHAHEETKAVGPGKAIEENDTEKGIRLSESALKNLKLELMPLKAGLQSVNKKVIVMQKDEAHIYRYRDGFFKLIKVSVKEVGAQLKIRPLSHVNGDQYVAAGADLIRISDVYANDDASYGHSH